MPLSFIIESDSGLVHATATGIISYADVLTYVGAKVRAGVMTNDELFDARDVTLDLSAADLPAIAGEVSLALAGRPAGRVALVTNSGFIYGLGKAYGELTQAVASRFGVFHEEETARAWLKAG